MATTDQLIAIAESLVQRLSKVKRNDWMRWVQVVDAYHGDMTRALYFAQRAAKDFTLRSNIRRAYGAIARAISGYQPQLATLRPQELQQVFGYVAWLLKIHNE